MMQGETQLDAAGAASDHDYVEVFLCGFAEQIIDTGKQTLDGSHRQADCIRMLDRRRVGCRTGIERKPVVGDFCVIGATHAAPFEIEADRSHE